MYDDAQLRTPECIRALEVYNERCATASVGVMDDYPKDGEPGVIRSLCSFNHNPLQY